MEICIKWNICRLCLQEESNSTNNVENPVQFFNIFNENDLTKQIYECSGVTVKQDDSLPEKICRRCLASVRHSILFRRTCRKSNDYLISVTQRAKSASKFLKLDHEEKAASFNNELNCSDTASSYAIFDDEGTNTSNGTNTEIECDDDICELSTLKDKKKIKLESTNSNPTDLKEVETQIPHASNDTELSHAIVMTKIESPKQDMYVNIEETLMDNNVMSNDKQLNEKAISDCEPIHELTCGDRDKDVLDDVLAKLHGDDNKSQCESSIKSKLKTDNNDMYFLLNDDDGCDADQEIQSQHEEQRHHENDSTLNDVSAIEYVCIETEVDNMGILDGIEDNRQVSSTVLINEKVTDINFEIEDDNSNISYNSHNSDSIQYILDEYIVSDKNDVNTSESYDRISPTKYTKKKKKDTIISKSDICFSKLLKNEFRRRSRDKKSLSINSDTKDSMFMCNICTNKFTNRQLLKAHLKIHRQEKTHECELCFKRFITACNLQAHMRIHTGEKPYECQYCGRRFTDRSTHLRHERVHTNEKPFKCEFCGRSFTLATTLQAHTRIHTGERPYKCQPCDKSFKLSHQLKAHQNTHLHKTIEQSIS